jgi:hypothetical protein
VVELLQAIGACQRPARSRFTAASTSR